MKCDIILTGIGGQGVLSIVKVLGPSALREGLYVKQTENHGIAQRGAAVTAHLRMAKHPVSSDLVPAGCADLIVAAEPLEALHCLPLLSPEGTVVSSSQPVVNIPDYPDPERLIEAIRSLPRAILVDAEKLAREAGVARASNMVMIGAIAHLLPLARENIEEHIRHAFGMRSEKVITANLKAFQAGVEAAQ
ncbi:MAG: indolepyruvate oxidoreductase subunit beta [bacterium]|nr:indolepyruvate oxidoreductase subunit beta [bacterium]